MFKNTYQKGLLSIFYSVGSNPLAIWDSSVKNGHIKRLTDEEVNSLVLEIVSTNVATTFIVCPRNNKVLGIKLPFLVMIVKNLRRYFSFEITILDDKNMRRRFRTSNYQSTTKIKPFCTSMPIGLTGGWNQVQFNLADFTRRAYGSQYVETLRVQIHANARIRRIYFSDRLYTEDQLPHEYKLFLPFKKKDKPAPTQGPGKADMPPAPPTEAGDVPASVKPEIEVVMEPIKNQDKAASPPKTSSKTSRTSVVTEAKAGSRKSSVQSVFAIAEGAEGAEPPGAEKEGVVGEEDLAVETLETVAEEVGAEPATEEPAASEKSGGEVEGIAIDAPPEPAEEANPEQPVETE